MSPELRKLFEPIVDVQPAYNLVAALWTEMPPEQLAFSRYKLAECAEEMAMAAKHIRKKLEESSLPSERASSGDE